MNPDTGELQAIAQRLWEQGPSLQAAGTERRARSLGETFTRLADPDHEVGRTLRQTLLRTTGLSPQGIDWGLRTAIAPLRASTLLRMAQSIPAPAPNFRPSRPGRMLAVILSGNVFTAPARALAYPLLLGWPVMAKASSADGAFASAFARTLESVDAPLASALSVVTFTGGDAAAEGVLLQQADAVSVYGSDHTLNEVRSRVPATAGFIGHGHGLGAVWVGAQALSDEQDAARAAANCALDIAAYDQRGCLSPHAVWVEQGCAVDAQRFGKLLFDALAEQAVSMPRGALPVQAGAAQLQWRGVAATRGTLHEGEGYAVAVEENGSLRLSPGYRNAQVLSAPSLDAFCRAMSPLGVHLKALGVAGQDMAQLAERLPASTAPALGPVGHMQTPAPDSPADGQPWWHGLLRWLSLHNAGDADAT